MASSSIFRRLSLPPPVGGYRWGCPRSCMLREACRSAWVRFPQEGQWNSAWVSRSPLSPQTKHVSDVYAGCTGT